MKKALPDTSSAPRGIGWGRTGPVTVADDGRGTGEAERRTAITPKGASGAARGGTVVRLIGLGAKWAVPEGMPGPSGREFKGKWSKVGLGNAVHRAVPTADGAIRAGSPKSRVPLGPESVDHPH